MKFLSLLFLLTIALILAGCKNNDNMKTTVYKDKNQPVNARVADLLSRMTIEEKVAQMVAAYNEVRDLIEIKPDGTFDIVEVKKALPNGIGQITRISETKGGQSQTASNETDPLTPYENAVLSNTLQRYFIEETRLGIPAIFHEESLHGLAAAHSTSFPQPIAMAGSFNPELIKKAYTLMAKETRLRGAHQVLSPVLDIARDARWGRVEETFGEDPYLTTIIGGAAIDGFQGNAEYKDGEHVLATLKHFAAHGQPEGGTNAAPANYSERTLREAHFSPFKNIIENHKIQAVMATYHELDGVPAHGNKWLMQQVLRKEWGYKGFVVSDYFAIRELHQREGVEAHSIARNGKHAAELAIKAGVNIELPFADTYKHIPEMIESGQVSMERIDELVGEMLKVKFDLGLFDNPYIDPEKAKQFCGIEEHRQLALETALECITLLENKNNIAPLNNSKINKIAVIGPNANRELLGGYSGVPNFKTSLFKSIQKYVGNSTEVVYSKGCEITIGGCWACDEVILPTPEQNKKLIKEAVAAAKNADVIVLGIGGNEQTSREAWSLTHMGDRSSLDLFGDQNQLINELHKLGKPIIAFVFNGRPLAFNNLTEKADAIFECWYLGQESGDACAKVLFGEFNPGGKLPITFPRSVGQIPMYYNRKPSARRGYIDSKKTPLYPFGYGLSYSNFNISDINLSAETIKTNESFKVNATVTNTGKYDGSEVVQVYIRDVQSSVTRPVKELKGFEKVFLKAGESKQIEIEIENKALAFYDINMDFVVEPGEFKIMIGNSSDDKDLKTFVLNVQ